MLSILNEKKINYSNCRRFRNQLFMYAFAYSLSKKLNYDLYIDNKSGFSKNKNLLRNHQFYMLNNFNIIENIADANMIYDTRIKMFQKKIEIYFLIFFF